MINRKARRDKLWPNADNLVAHTRLDEFCCEAVPRIVPLVCALAEHIKDRPGAVTAAYVDLCLRTTGGDGFVQVDDELECAAAAGFLGGRALWSWRERVRTLERLGLIQIKGEGHREIAYILINNPERAADELLTTHSKKVPPVWLDYYEKRQRQVGVIGE